MDAKDRPGRDAGDDDLDAIDRHHADFEADLSGLRITEEGAPAAAGAHPLRRFAAYAGGALLLLAGSWLARRHAKRTYERTR